MLTMVDFGWSKFAMSTNDPAKLPSRDLTADEVDSLCRSSWLTPELVEQALIRYLDDQEARQQLGIKGRQSEEFQGLAFPYHDLKEERLRALRVRRSNPPVDTKPDGATKEKNKYMTAPGTRNMLYFVPSTPLELLDDADLPVAITEGEKKTLALYRLSHYEVESPRFLPVGLSGVWNWRGTVGFGFGPQGKRRPEKGTIPDLDLITWANRRVFIVFDSDVQANQKGAHARQARTAELQRRGGKVRWIDLPVEPQL